MKNFKMKQVPLSKKADFKIRMKLAFAHFRKNMQGFKLLQIAVPTLLVGVIAIGIFQNIGTTNTPGGNTLSVGTSNRIMSEISESRSAMYKQRAKKRAYVKKAAAYKQYAYVRSSKLRNK